MKVLVDEMYDGLDDLLIEKGFEAQSVKKLIAKGEKLKSDFSVLNYTRDNGMVLVTEDKENEKACLENNIPYICLNKEQVFNTILESLKKL